MQVRELIEMGKFLKEFIQAWSLPSLYKELINAVNQAAQNQNPENVINIYRKLKEIHAEADKRVLSAAQQ